MGLCGGGASKKKGGKSGGASKGGGMTPKQAQAAVKKAAKSVEANGGRVVLLGVPLGGGAVPKPLVKAVGKMTSLTLGNNGLGRVPRGLEVLAPGLTELNITDNSIKMVPLTLGEFTSLQSLSLSKNRIVPGVPTSIGKLGALTHLDISHNKIKSLNDGFGGLGSLTRLNVSHNELTALPECLVRLGSLTGLNASANAITAVHPRYAELTSLVSLDLSDNALVHFEVDVSAWSRLRMIQLDGNMLLDLPLSLGALRGGVLTVVALEGNTLDDMPDDIVPDMSTPALLDALARLVEAGSDSGDSGDSGDGSADPAASTSVDIGRIPAHLPHPMATLSDGGSVGGSEPGWFVEPEAVDGAVACSEEFFGAGLADETEPEPDSVYDHGHTYEDTHTYEEEEVHTYDEHGDGEHVGDYEYEYEHELEHEYEYAHSAGRSTGCDSCSNGGASDGGSSHRSGERQSEPLNLSALDMPELAASDSITSLTSILTGAESESSAFTFTGIVTVGQGEQFVQREQGRAQRQRQRRAQRRSSDKRRSHVRSLVTKLLNQVMETVSDVSDKTRAMGQSEGKLEILHRVSLLNKVALQLVNDAAGLSKAPDFDAARQEIHASMERAAKLLRDVQDRAARIDTTSQPREQLPTRSPMTRKQHEPSFAASPILMSSPPPQIATPLMPDSLQITLQEADKLLEMVEADEVQPQPQSQPWGVRVPNVELAGGGSGDSDGGDGGDSGGGGGEEEGEQLIFDLLRGIRAQVSAGASVPVTDGVGDALPPTRWTPLGSPPRRSYIQRGFHRDTRGSPSGADRWDDTTPVRPLRARIGLPPVM